MARYYEFGLKRLFNYYRLQKRLNDPIATKVCPVCLKDDCGHEFNKINRNDANNLLKWWQDVIVMELHDLPYILDNEMLPLLIFDDVTIPVKPISISNNCKLGLLYNGKFYDAMGNVTPMLQNNSAAQYGWLCGNEFTTFATFQNGYFIPTNLTSDKGDKTLLVPAETTACYNWGIKLL